MYILDLHYVRMLYSGAQGVKNVASSNQIRNVYLAPCSPPNKQDKNSEIMGTLALGL